MTDHSPARTGWTAAALTFVALVMALLIVDGVDIQLLSLLAPVILAEWGIERAAFGAPLSAALIGMAMGTAAGGWLGDRIGWMRVLIGAALLFGTATIAAGFARGVADLTALRVIAGLGFGAAGPNGIALALARTPPRLRTTLAGVMAVATPLGGIVGAMTVLSLAGAIGWRGCFILCGTVSLATIAAIALVRRMGAEPDAPAPGAGGDAAIARGRILDPALRRLNAGIWLSFFAIQFAAYGFLSWVPTYLTAAGTTLATALTASLAYNIASVVVAMFGGALIERFGFHRPLMAAGLAAAGGALLMGFAVSAGHAALLSVAGALTGGGAGVAISSLYAVAMQRYPAGTQSTGLGISLTAGRIGGIVAAAGGGALFSLPGIGLWAFPAALAGAALLAIAAGRLVGDRPVSASHA